MHRDEELIWNARRKAAVFELDVYCLLAALGIAFIASIMLTPMMRDLARRVGLMDAPDGRRKHQQQPIPRAGGPPILAAMAIGLVGLTYFGFDIVTIVSLEPRLLSLLGATSIMLVVGLIDDRWGLRGRYKLVGQFAAVTLLVYCGHLSIQKFSLFGVYFDLGTLGLVLTYLWMIGIINAINLIDGMDGLLGLIGVLVCLSLAVTAGIIGDSYVAIVSATLAGALLGFLCFNLPPASVYLGDSGSMVIGLILGALSIQGSMKAPTAMALAVPITVLILPILDTAAAIARRKLTGRSIYTTDRGHLHHCLLRSGLNRPAVLSLVTILGLIASAGAVLATLLHNDMYAVTGALLVVVILVTSRLFGHAEFTLIRAKCRALAALLWNGNRVGKSHQVRVRLQGSVEWQGLWEELTAAAFQNNLRSLCLDVNAPAMHEAYHARWDRFGADSHSEESHEWRADLPIAVSGRVIGRLIAVGMIDEEPIWIKLQNLAEIARTTELNVHQLTLIDAAATPSSKVSSSALHVVGAPS